MVEMPTTIKQKCWALLICLAVAFLVYGNSLHGEFVYDDIPLLVDNHCHQGFHNLQRIFNFKSDNICSLRPLRFFSFMLDYALWGQNVFGYHLTNIFLHGLNAWLFFLILLKLKPDLLFAGAGAALFLVHPISTEAVSYISGRRDLLMALFMLLVCREYLSYQTTGGLWRLPLLALFMFAALLSHESAAALPVFLFVLAFCQAGPKETFLSRLRQLLKPRQIIPLSMLLIICLGFALFSVKGHNFSERHALWGPTLGAHIGTVFRMHAHYLKQLIWPLNLIADYSFDAFSSSQSFFSWSVILIVALLLSALLLLRKAPLICFSIVGYFVMLLPTSQIVIHHELLAEHRLYFPALCFYGLLALGLRQTIKYSRRVGFPFIAVILAGLSILTLSRNLDWRSPLSLWQITVDQVPRCARAQSNLGAALATAQKFSEAEPHLRQAITIKPDLCEAHLNLGLLLFDTNRPDLGLEQIKQAVKCKPSKKHLEILKRKTVNPSRI